MSPPVKRSIIGVSMLRPLIAGRVNLRVIEEHWDETLRLAASIRAGTAISSIMLRKLAGFRVKTRSLALCAR